MDYKCCNPDHDPTEQQDSSSEGSLNAASFKSGHDDCYDRAWNQPCEDKYDHISIPNSNILEIPVAMALDLSDTPLCEVCRNSGSFGKRHPCGTKETCPAGACSRSPMEHPQRKSVAIPPPESPPINAVIRSSRPPCPPKPRAKAGSPLRSPRLPRPRRGSFVANQFPPPICDDLRDLRANSQISL
jgi:hypothetical protein